MINIYIVFYEEIFSYEHVFHAAYVSESDAKEEVSKMNNEYRRGINYYILTEPLHGCNHPIEPS